MKSNTSPSEKDKLVPNEVGGGKGVGKNIYILVVVVLFIQIILYYLFTKHFE